MRKLLLATVALGGFAVYNGVSAQPVDDAGQSTTSAMGGAVIGGTTQAPGTLVVRLNGRVYSQIGWQAISNANGSIYYNGATNQTSSLPFLGNTVAVATVGGSPTVLPQFFGSAAQATAMGYRPATTAAGPQNVVVVPNQPGVNKNANYQLSSFFRLYPGFDGIAANGLMYGAGVEIRADGNWPSGNGQNASISADSARQGLMYLRKYWGYAGTPTLGMLRFGQTDGPSSLFMVGNNENFGDGGLNGAGYGYLPVQLWYYWPFADGGGNYGTQKIVYLSPVFAGFDFGASFAPSSNGAIGAAATQGCNAPNAGLANSWPAGPGIAGAGCINLSSTNTSDYLRPRNIYDVAARYRGLFGPIGFAAYLNYMGSGTVADTVATPHPQVDGYSIGMGGAQVTYGGLTIGAMARGGRVNGVGLWSTVPKGAAPEVDVEFGGSYTYGPFVVGTHILRSWSAGASGPAYNPNGLATGAVPSVGQRRETGLAVGGTYSVAPGFALNLTYEWSERFNNGYDFMSLQSSYPVSPVNNLGCGPSGNAGSTAACLHNKVDAQVFMLGASLTW